MSIKKDVELICKSDISNDSINFDYEANLAYDSYVSAWENKSPNYSWLLIMKKADLTISKFIGEFEISNEIREKLLNKFKEIYPKILKYFETILK